MSRKTKADIIQEVNTSIIGSLRNGTVPWRCPYKPQMSIAGHVYRGINRLVLGHTSRESEYSSPYWLTFNAVRKREGHVIKGESGTTIIYNGYSKYEADDGEERFRHVFKSWNVFNLDQCEFEDHDFLQWVPEQEPSKEVETLIREYLTREEIPLTHVSGYASYSPKKDSINVPTRQSLVSPEHYLPTLFHEMGHSTGAAKRLNRSGITDFDAFGSHQYSTEELVAEMTCAYLCGYTSQDLSHLDQSASYIEHWISKLEEDPEILATACTEAEKAFQYIMEGKHDMEERDNA